MRCVSDLRVELIDISLLSLIPYFLLLIFYSLSLIPYLCWLSIFLLVFGSSDRF